MSDWLYLVTIPAMFPRLLRLLSSPLLLVVVPLGAAVVYTR